MYSTAVVIISLWITGQSFALFLHDDLAHACRYFRHNLSMSTHVGSLGFYKPHTELYRLHSLSVC